ncbi:MAG: efflux RND transporter periplasmic adaptor subunit [Desulfuromonadales bacterium]|nr:efflux RND transporter periplasmic adaptor subunit [Desulfuromonadales bacterium]
MNLKTIKNLILSLLVVAAAAGVGWGTYTFAGPSHSAGGGHEGHEHEEKTVADPHGQAGSRGEGTRDPHDHGDDDDEDLETLFADEKVSSPEEHHEDGDDHDDHHGDDHASHAQASPRKDVHAGHEHSAHGHPGGDEICPEHNVPEIEDALCQPDLVSHLQPGEGMKVRLAAPETAGRVGIVTAAPLPAGEEGVAWPGQVVFNRDRLARLSALAGGTVQKVNVGLGQKVSKGQVLAEIASPETAGLRAELAAAESRRALAEAVYQREKDLLEKGITSRHEFQQAEAELRQAQSAATRAARQMQDFGLSAGSVGSVLPIRAPFAGTVIERAAVPGEAVSPGSTLFVLADLSTVWVETSVPEDALLAVHPGLEIVASFSGLPGRAFAGKIFWVAPALDERTRMLKILAEVDNRDGLLRSGLFGQVQGVAKTAGGTLAVPADALQTVDGNPFVFVRLEDDLFELRRVMVGRRSQGAVTISQGLHAHDRVVMAQAFSLKSELLRARLGASCADH